MNRKIYAVSRVVAVAGVVIALIIGLAGGYFLTSALAPPTITIEKTVTAVQATVTTTALRTVTTTVGTPVAPKRDYHRCYR